MPNIALAKTDEELRRAYPVMAELRPHLTLESFLEQVRRQQSAHGYAVAFLEDAGQVTAVAGFRIAEFLAWGRILYVDDLVTTAVLRAKGPGQLMMNWLLDHARAQGCLEFHLDSGVQRFEAHGFYLKNRLHIRSHHFSRKLT